MFHPNFEGLQGEVELSIELLTECESRVVCPAIPLTLAAAESSSRPNGKGRDAPNECDASIRGELTATAIRCWRSLTAQRTR